MSSLIAQGFSGEKDFSHQCIFTIIIPLEKGHGSLMLKKMLCTKLSRNWPSGSGELKHITIIMCNFKIFYYVNNSQVEGIQWHKGCTERVLMQN